ncbi:hypothetical protein GQ53DRAFT_754293 [Thozetella sp. PMI_491]|nr:hypothetical protein GQ53DRAFT_754293 [Thozetella sp. PMI_491]
MSRQRKPRTAAMPPQPDPAVEETSFEADGYTTPQLEAQPRSGVISGRDGNSGYGTVPAPDEPTNGVSQPTEQPKSPARAIAPDLLRGLLMMLMALDHNALALNAWSQSTVIVYEDDSVVAHEWNVPVAFVLRIFTDLCAPGFTMLLGMGIVYFGRSRTNQGWSSQRMARHFFIRGLVLTAVTVAIGVIMTAGSIWFFNIVLFALAVDYTVAGLLWLAMSWTEKTLAAVLLKVLPDADEDDPREPLIQRRDGLAQQIAPDRKIVRAANISWHLHNAALLVLGVNAMWWNIWMSPTGGHCRREDTPDGAAWASFPANNWLRIWFYPVEEPGVLSRFPPFAWLSFAILGLLYGRIVLARSWSTRQIVLGNSLAGLASLVLFSLTRVLRFGNLSEDCLQMPEHLAHPGANQYLASVWSFFYLVKYPPDVAFATMTTGGNLMLLALFSAVPSRFAVRWGHVLQVFGTSALFFYVVHLPVLFGFGRLARAWLAHPTGRIDPHTGEEMVGVDSLWGFFGNWLLLMVVMYFLCKHYGAFKRTKGPDSLWRFF